MRYSLLNFLCCPVSHTRLTCVTFEEVDAPLPHIHLSECHLVNPPGALVGPVPDDGGDTPVAEALRAHAAPPAPPERNEQVTVKEGLLVSASTGRWHPIRDFVPELLPDHLRRPEADQAFLASVRDRLPGTLADALRVVDAPQEIDDPGLAYKTSEMGITEKVEENFFGPGHIAPFNPHTRDHTAFLIRMFGLCLPHVLGDGSARTVLDTGCGYAWTTEWMWRMGLEAIGSDITRAYIDVALKRLGPQIPHLVVADTERLPFRTAGIDVVLGYDSFHHIPERRRAMAEFDRVLTDEGRVVLAEPNGEHEHVAGSKDVMEKYGILERGMEWEDVKAYTEGTRFGEPEQYHVLGIPRSRLRGWWRRPRIGNRLMEQTAVLPCNLFVIPRS